MKKITFIIGGLGGGGAERMLAQIASFLADSSNFEVSIITYYQDQVEYSFSKKINRVNMSGGTIEDYIKLSFIKKLKLIKNNIKKLNPDDIVCFLPHSFVFTCFALIFSKYFKKIIYAERANPNFDSSKIGKIRNFFVKKIKRIIVQNSGQKKLYSSKTKAKIYKIPNFISSELFNNEKKYSTKPIKIVSVGRLTKQKNYKLAISAIEQIKHSYSSIEYYIYGIGNQKQELENYVKKLNLQECIHFVGFESDRNKIYKDKDIFLMTSSYEGMPNTLAEAMAFGIPAISTNCDFGPCDLIMDNNMGILLNDFEVSTCTEGLKNVIENYDEFVKKAIFAKKTLKKMYNQQCILDKWVNFFNDKL